MWFGFGRKQQLYSGGGFSFNYFYNLNYNGHTVDHVQPADVMTKGDQPRAEFWLIPWTLTTTVFPALHVMVSLFGLFIMACPQPAKVRH